jgi:hypothetical protein
MSPGAVAGGFELVPDPALIVNVSVVKQLASI